MSTKEKSHDHQAPSFQLQANMCAQLRSKGFSPQAKACSVTDLKMSGWEPKRVQLRSNLFLHAAMDSNCDPSCFQHKPQWVQSQFDDVNSSTPEHALRAEKSFFVASVRAALNGRWEIKKTTRNNSRGAALCCVCMLEKQHAFVSLLLSL